MRTNRTIDVIKDYVEVNDEVKRETIRYLEVLTHFHAPKQLCCMIVVT